MGGERRLEMADDFKGDKDKEDNRIVSKTKGRRGTSRGGQGHGQGRGQGVCGAQIQLLMGRERRMTRKHNYKAEESDSAGEDKGKGKDSSNIRIAR